MTQTTLSKPIRLSDHPCWTSFVDRSDAIKPFCCLGTAFAAVSQLQSTFANSPDEFWRHVLYRYPQLLDWFAGCNATSNRRIASGCFAMRSHNCLSCEQHSTQLRSLMHTGSKGIPCISYCPGGQLYCGERANSSTGTQQLCGWTPAVTEQELNYRAMTAWCIQLQGFTNWGKHWQ